MSPLRSLMANESPSTTVSAAAPPTGGTVSAGASWGAAINSVWWTLGGRLRVRRRLHPNGWYGSEHACRPLGRGTEGADGPAAPTAHLVDLLHPMPRMWRRADP